MNKHTCKQSLNEHYTTNYKINRLPIGLRRVVVLQPSLNFDCGSLWGFVPPIFTVWCLQYGQRWWTRGFEMEFFQSMTKILTTPSKGAKTASIVKLVRLRDATARFYTSEQNDQGSGQRH